MQLRASATATIRPSPARVGDAVRRIQSEFCRRLPPGARSNEGYRSDGNDRFALLDPCDRQGEPVDIPDGVYRVEGGDWLLTFRRSRLVAAEVATPANEFGGAAVITVSGLDRELPPMAYLSPREQVSADVLKPQSVRRDQRLAELAAASGGAVSMSPRSASHDV